MQFRSITVRCLRWLYALVNDMCVNIYMPPLRKSTKGVRCLFRFVFKKHNLSSKSICSAASIAALCVQHRVYICNFSLSTEIVKVSSVISILKQWVLATVANRAITAVARWPSSKRCIGPGVRCRCSSASQRHQLLAQRHFASHLVLNGQSEFLAASAEQSEAHSWWILSP